MKFCYKFKYLIYIEEFSNHENNIIWYNDDLIYFDTIPSKFGAPTMRSGAIVHNL
jgi:hypothetical protein